MKDPTKETYQLERRQNDKKTYRKTRYLMGKSVPTWSAIKSGYLAYLEFDVFWKPKHSTCCRSVALFAKSVLTVKEALVEYDGVMVFPLSGQNEIDALADGTGILSSLSKRDQELAAILLSMSHLYVDLAVIERNPGYKSEIAFRVKKSYEIQNSFPRPDVKMLKLMFPFHFVWKNTVSNNTRHLTAFVISYRK